MISVDCSAKKALHEQSLNHGEKLIDGARSELHLEPRLAYCAEQSFPPVFPST